MADIEAALGGVTDCRPQMGGWCLRSRLTVYMRNDPGMGRTGLDHHWHALPEGGKGSQLRVTHEVFVVGGRLSFGTSGGHREL